MSTPRLQKDRLVRLLYKPPEKIGDLTLLSLWHHAPSLHTFTKGLLQGAGVTCTGSLCLPDGDCTCGLCIPDCGCAVGLFLFDGLGSLGLILTQGGFGMRYQSSLAGVHRSLSVEQLPHDHIHFLVQSKYLLRQGTWVSPGVRPRPWSGGNTGNSQSF